MRPTRMRSSAPWPPRTSSLAGRIQALEDKARSLTESLPSATGANEELRHQIDLLNQKIDQQQKDFAYRLCMVSAQQLGAGASDQGLNCAATGTAAANRAPPPPGALPPGAPLPPIDATPTPAPDRDRPRPPAGAARHLGPRPAMLGRCRRGRRRRRPAVAGQFDARDESAGQGAICRSQGGVPRLCRRQSRRP